MRFWLRWSIRPRAVEDEDFADVLHGRSAEARAETLQDVLTTIAAIAQNAHFDELVGDQAAFDFGGYRRGQAASADQNGRLDGMSASLERTAFGG